MKRWSPGAFNWNECPLPGVCVLLGSVTNLTVSVWSSCTPSTQLHKPLFTAAKPALRVAFPVYVHDLREQTFDRKIRSQKLLTVFILGVIVLIFSGRKWVMQWRHYGHVGSLTPEKPSLSTLVHSPTICVPLVYLVLSHTQASSSLSCTLYVPLII